MWMFLEPEPSDQPTPVAAGPDRPGTAASAGVRAVSSAAHEHHEPGEAFLPASGATVAIPISTSGEGPAEVDLYVHPGRLHIGRMSAARIFEQLDMARAVLFDSLAAAELAADAGAGFLVDFLDPFADEHGVQRDGGCYFVGRMTRAGGMGTTGTD